MILLLCVLDSFLTLKLLAAGSREENPVMALFVYGDTLHFVLAKLALTGAGLLVLVACARFRVFRLLRVDAIVHTVLAGYVMVIAYELTLAANLS
ncbi:MAG: DUF5658 family protein [Proteobacteria bacterium]|nr:DUF5658 family protein [Pseudomonadota bacterium]